MLDYLGVVNGAILLPIALAVFLIVLDLSTRDGDA